MNKEVLNRNFMFICINKMVKQLDYLYVAQKMISQCVKIQVHSHPPTNLTSLNFQALDFST